MERVDIHDDLDSRRRPMGYRAGVVPKTANFAITVDDHGKIFECSAAGTGVTATLPSNAKNGFRVGLSKANATTDLFFQAPTGQSINFGTAGKIYRAVTDGDGVPVTAEVMFDGANWKVTNRVGTWANDNT
jgi:hypothetical protein